MDFAAFKKEWLSHMAHSYDEEDLEGKLHNEYIEYKEENELDKVMGIKDSFASRMTVKEFCHFFYIDSHIDSHRYMLKIKYKK